MSIEWLRDLVIIIFSLVNIAFLIFVSVLLYSVYQKTRNIQDSLIRVVSVVEAACGLLKPLIQIANVITGIFQGISSATQAFRNKGGKKHG